MRIDITVCNKVNVIDSCALWNVYSSKILSSVLEEEKFIFSCTDYVVYECLHRPRSKMNLEDERLKTLFKGKLSRKEISSHPLTIEDLQQDDILKERRRLGMGELSSLAFAKKTGLFFLTDDQKARNIGGTIIGPNKIQTTPKILGWLFYNGLLGDADLEPIIDEHNKCGRPLDKYFRDVHAESWRIRAL